MNARTSIRSLPLFAAFLLLPACMFVDSTLTLTSSGVATNLHGGDGRQLVVTIPFTDEREIRERCGMKASGAGQDTSSLLCSADPPTWIAQLLASELRAVGFSVVTEAASAKPGAVYVKGSLLKLFARARAGTTFGLKTDMGAFEMETDMHVKLVATTPTGLLAERSFFVQGVKLGSLTDAGYQASLDDATRKLLKGMVAAVLSLMNRYPQLGINNTWSPGATLALASEAQ